MDVAGLLVAVLALIISLTTSRRQLRQASNANVVPVLIDLFREHRTEKLTAARRFVYQDLEQYDLTEGMGALPDRHSEALRALMAYYDNLGAMVAHGVIDLDPVAGYIGGTVVDMWDRLEVLVANERPGLAKGSDPDRPKWYFEYLAHQVRTRTPSAARPRMHQRTWRVH